MTSASLAKSGGGELGYFKQLPGDVYRATRPMLYILQSQMSRRYYEWSETQPVSQNKQGPLKWWLCQYSGNGNGTSTSTGQIPIRRLSLVGTVLYIETREDGKLEEYPLIDSESGQSNVKLDSNSLEIVTRHRRHHLLLQSSEPELLLCLQLLVTVSIFEYFSCYRAITGSLISTLGLSLPDIHLLLRSKFNYKDWCEIYIEGEGWVKAWCHVNRDSRLCARNYKADGKYQIKFYRSNKSSSPNDVASNLICYIPDSCRVEDIVFYTGNHHKSETVGDNDTAMVTRFLDGLNCIKVIGDVMYPASEKPELSSSSSSSSPSSTSTWSFSHKRHVSTNSVKPSKAEHLFVKRHSGLLIKPVPHRGISPLESLIRLVIPLLDVARKYGRPDHFKTSRTDFGSLMFGLPRLPEVNYLTDEQIRCLLEAPQVKPEADIGDVLAFSMLSGSKYLESCL